MTPAPEVTSVRWRGRLRPRLVLDGPAGRVSVRPGPLTGSLHQELARLVESAERSGARVDPVAVGFLGYREVTDAELRTVSRRVLRRVVLGYAAAALTLVALFILAAR